MLEETRSEWRMYGASVRLWQVEEKEEGEGEEFCLLLPEIQDIRSFLLSLMGSLTRDFLLEEKTAVAVARAIPNHFQEYFIKKENTWLEVDKGDNSVAKEYLEGGEVDDNNMMCFDEIENDATMEEPSPDNKLIVFASQNVIEGHDDDIETSDVDDNEEDAQISEGLKEQAKIISKTKFNCSECTKVFASPSHFKQHLKSHENYWPYPCNICDAKFKQVKYLKKHKVENHEDLFCPTCKVYHRNATELKEHHCSKPFQCPSCHRRFGTVCELKAHSLIHSGEKPHMCDLCGKGFRQRATLDRHKLTHQSKKNHSCEICGKNFKFKHYLVSHKRLHTGEKPHMCTWCGQSFSQSANMQKHIRQQHTMEKNHVCKQCGKSFVQPYYLKRHLLTHREGKHKTDLLSYETEEIDLSEDCIGVRTVPCSLCSATTKTEKQLQIHMEMHHNLKMHIVSAEKETSTRDTEEEQENLSQSSVKSNPSGGQPSPAHRSHQPTASLMRDMSPTLTRPVLIVDQSSNIQRNSSNIQRNSSSLQQNSSSVQQTTQIPPSSNFPSSKVTHILPASHVHSSNIHLKLMAARKINQLHSQQIRYEH